MKVCLRVVQIHMTQIGRQDWKVRTWIFSAFMNVFQPARRKGVPKIMQSGPGSESRSQFQISDDFSELLANSSFQNSFPPNSNEECGLGV